MILWIILGIVAVLATLYFWDGGREWLFELISEGWEALGDVPSDVWEFVSGAFEGLGEFSAGGGAMAIFAFVVLFMSRKNLFKAFDLFPPAQKIFWIGLTFIGSIAMAYIMGRRAFES